MENMKLLEVEKVYDQIEHFLKKHHGINHITLQAEVDKCSDKNIFKS
jgi:Co/Zn/Cd efflux system component